MSEITKLLKDTSCKPFFQSLPGYSSSRHHTSYKQYAISAVHAWNAAFFPHNSSGLSYCLYSKNHLQIWIQMLPHPTYLFPTCYTCLNSSNMSVLASTILNPLPDQLSAYQLSHLTETAIVSIYNDLVCITDSGKVFLLVLLDLSAAFNTINHVILLSVLADWFWIHSMAIGWFKSYLRDRTQICVYTAGHTSNFPVDCSVAHGSVMSPRCFIIIIIIIRKFITCT